MNEAELVKKVERIINRLGLKVNVGSGPHPIEPDGGIHIYLDDEAVSMFQVKVESILGTQTVQGWAVYKAVHDPGVRYYPDGSGDPPSYEMVPVKEDILSVGEAVKVMILTYVESIIDDCYTVFSEEEEVTELAEESWEQNEAGYRSLKEQ